MSHKIVKINLDDFLGQFKPIKNHIDTNASFNGKMFETFGDELNFVKQAHEKNPLTVWTLTDCSGLTLITDGYHFVNRMGYLITEVPAQADTEYVISDGLFAQGNTGLYGDVLMPDIFDYDTPDEISEWAWIEKNASFKHAKNGEDGVFEFMLNTSLDFTDIPSSLAPYIEEAKDKKIAYLLFHQGT